ncbi:hypothetical protein [Streptomyces sp. NPDC091268]|uniref:hypothetical protein n=1 Tax=Streptomyces sp. NPDC091268 TaxID=3365979 RepID=UPI0037FC7376
MRKASRAAALLTLCGAAAAALTGCGGPPPDGYLAVGAAAAGPERSPGQNVAPQGPVEFQPLAAPSAAGASGTSGSTSATTPESRPPGGSARTGGASPAPGGSATPPAATPGAGQTTVPSRTPGDAPTGSGGPGGQPSRPGTTAPAAPANLSLSTPTRAPAADRWCEQVTVSFTNTGGTAARSGSVAFATHVIGALGIDWATLTTSQPLPGPIAGGSARTQTYTVCVESWRVPLGMHVETRKVTATWS